MARATKQEYISATIIGHESFIIGRDEVTEIGIGQGQPGFVQLVIAFGPETARYFMVSPSALVLEVGPPVEVEIPDEPKLVVPKPTIVRG